MESIPALKTPLADNTTMLQIRNGTKGKLSDELLQQILALKVMKFGFRTFLKMADTDNDGKMSQKELKNAIDSVELITKLNKKPTSIVPWMTLKLVNQSIGYIMTGLVALQKFPDDAIGRNILNCIYLKNHDFVQLLTSPLGFQSSSSIY